MSLKPSPEFSRSKRPSMNCRKLNVLQLCARERWKTDKSVCLSVNLFEELQVNSILEKLSHSTGAMVHKGLLIKCYRLTLKMQERRPAVTIKFNISYPCLYFISVINSAFWPGQCAGHFCSSQRAPPDSWGRLEPHHLQWQLKPSLNDLLKMKPVGHLFTVI